MKGEMTMKKGNTDGKEIDKKDAAPLSDGELESAAGGIGSYLAHRWYCFECDAHGTWSSDINFVEKEKGIHNQKTGHTCFDIIWNILPVDD
jgi:hypothetical protein